ncbi:MAG TPA: WD40 repeat domain-containing protein, partial [Dongiaceae bacterium]|nr:WD40 repeat domain-containing protein [Dongiaceae bacterium]
RQHLYAADMLLAQKAIEADNLGRAIELLDKHRPPGTLNRQPSTQPGAPPSGGRNSRNTVTVRPQASTDLRGWEWYYLRGRCASDELATLGAHSNAVTALAFSPDGRFLATADFAGGLRLWDVPRRQLLAAFADTGREIIALAFSPDGQILATGGMDERIRIYDTATRRLALPPRLQSGWLLALAFSADGHRLQSCSREEIDRWEFPAMQRVFRAKVEAQYRVAFAPDGGTLAIGGSRGRVRLYEPATRRETNLEGHTDLIDALVFAPDGRTLYTGSSDASARAWDVATGKQIALFEGHKLDVHAVAVSLDGRSVATASSDETIRLWNARTRLQVGLLRGQNSPVWELAFAPNGQILASGGKDGQVKLWPATPRPPIVESLPLPKPVRIWKLAPDGSAFDLLTPQGTVRSLDWRSLDFLPPQPFPAELGACSPIQPGGRLRAVEEGRGVVSLWERSSGQRLDQLKGALYPARSMTFSPDGQTLAIAAYERDLQLWHVPTCRLIRPLIGPTNTVSGPLSFSPDGRQLAALYLDGYVAVWNLARPQFPAIWRAHGMFVHAGTFSPDGRWLATGAGDGLAKIWEISTRREIKTLPVSLLSVLSLAFSPDGRRLAAAGSDGTVTLFDLATFQPIAHFHGHADPSLYGLAFWPDGTTLVSVSLKDIVIRRAPTLAESLKRSPPRGDE